MNYQQFSPIMREVLAFFGSGRILANAVAGNVSEIYVERIFEHAKTLAFEATFGPNEFTWADIRSEQTSKIWKTVYATPDYQQLDKELVSISGIIEKGIKKNLGTTCFQELLDDVISDFRGCLYSRAFEGITNKFYEGLFDVYKAGGWPCGWDGMYLEGDLVAYFP